jgi:sugar phosphate isomerase/epimerase
MKNNIKTPILDSDILPMLGFVHVGVPWRLLPEYMDIIVEHRMSIELGITAEDLERVSRSEFRTAADSLQKAGCRMTLHGPFWDLCPGSYDPLVRQVSRLRLHEFFDILSLFKPIQVVCHTGFDPRHHGGYRYRWVKESMALWEPLVERAERMGIPLLIENVWEYDPELHADILRMVDSPWFGFCLDVGHQHSFSRTPLSVWVETLGEYLREIHLHDNDGSGDAHLPIGQGTIDFDPLLGLLKDGSKPIVLTLEPHKEAHLSETLRGFEEVIARALPGFHQIATSRND